MNLLKFLLPSTLSSLVLLATLVPSVSVNAQQLTPPSTRECPPQNILVPLNVAVIVHTASTNTPCYRIYVPPTGEATYVGGNNIKGSGKLPVQLTRKFFQAIKKAEPLSKLPTQSCAKPVSFATSTFIRLGSEQSPDVSCAGDKKGKTLYKDTTAIAQYLKLAP